MFGTASDEFGSGRFGRADFPLLAIYNSFPRLHRKMDSELGFPLKKFMKGFSDELEEIRIGIRDINDQRDPILVRGGAGAVLYDISTIVDNGDGTSTVTLDSDHLYEKGNVVCFAGVSTGTPTIVGEYTIEEVPNPASTLTASQFKIKAAMTVPATNGIVKLKDRRSTLAQIDSYSEYLQPYRTDGLKDRPMVQFNIADGIDLSDIGIGYTARIDFTNGVTPAFPVTAGPTIDSYTFTVLRITRREDGLPLSLLCSGRFIDPALPVPDPLVLNFIQPNLIKLLSDDFGIEIDENEPEFYQRSTVRNIVQFIEKKSSERGYEIRSEAAGFDAEVQGLFALCVNPGLPEGRLYRIENEVGETKLYTDIEPKTFLFDEIAADVTGIDWGDGGAVIPLTDQYIYSDESSDTLSPGANAAQCLSSFNATFVLPANQTQKDLYGIDHGIYIAGTMTPDEWEKASNWADGSWSVFGPAVPPLSVADPVANYDFDYRIVAATFISGVNVVELVVETDPAQALVTVPGTYCMKYIPEVLDDCCFCKSHVIRLALSPTSQFLNETDFSGEQVNEALKRLVDILKVEQVPIHARIGEVALAATVNVTKPAASVSVSGVLKKTFVTVSGTHLYDVIPADDETTDLTKQVTSVTVT